MEGKIHGLDLFSGIGGISQALAPWVRTVTYCERERYAQGVLLSRMSKGQIDSAPIWDDVTTLTHELLPRIDIISGGFPCQDLSVAGHGRGLEGSRSGLFFEIVRLARDLRPRFLFLENVPAIRTRGLHSVVQELTKIGFDCRWTMLSASEVGAKHKRERWFLLANSNSPRQVQNPPQSAQWNNQIESFGSSETLGHPQCSRFSKGANESGNCHDWEASVDSGDSSETPTALADTKCFRSEGCKHEGWSRLEEGLFEGSGETGFTPDFWSVEPGMGRVVDGVSNRSHRIKCLGNGVVPLQVRTAFQMLLYLHGFQ